MVWYDDTRLLGGVAGVKGLIFGDDVYVVHVADGFSRTSQVRQLVIGDQSVVVDSRLDYLELLEIGIASRQTTGWVGDGEGDVVFAVG